MVKQALLGLAMLLGATTANAFNLEFNPLDFKVDNGYTAAEIQVAIELVERHYEERLDKDVRVYVIPKGLMSERIMGYYDHRGPMIWIVNGRATSNTIWRIYILAHELGHHLMADWHMNDHCLMYQDGGYDHLILEDLGVDNPYERYIDPFATLWQCDDY